MLGDTVLGLIVSLILGNGTIIVEDAREPVPTINPTLICPNGTTWQPGQPCM